MIGRQAIAACQVRSGGGVARTVRGASGRDFDGRRERRDVRAVWIVRQSRRVRCGAVAAWRDPTDGASDWPSGNRGASRAAVSSAWRDPCAACPGETSTDGESGATFGRCGSSDSRGASRAAVSSAWRDPCAARQVETSTDGESGATFAGADRQAVAACQSRR